MKKYTKIFLILIIVICFTKASPSFALKQAIFPDEQSLQPMPKNIQPNISGNINSTVSSDAPSENETVPEPAPLTENLQVQIEAEKNTLIFTWVAIIIIFLTGVLFFVYSYRKDKLKKPN